MSTTYTPISKTTQALAWLGSAVITATLLAGIVAGMTQQEDSIAMAGPANGGSAPTVRLA